MALTPPTLVSPTAGGRMLELGAFVLAAQLVPEQNPDSVAMITNFNLDWDTFVGSFVVNFEFTTKTDATTGELVTVVTDPFVDKTP